MVSIAIKIYLDFTSRGKGKEMVVMTGAYPLQTI